MVGKLGSGSATKAQPIKNCPGVNASTLSSASRRCVRGWLFKQDSILVNMVVSSSNVSLTFPTMRDRCFLQPLMDNPPKCGACSGIKSH